MLPHSQHPTAQARHHTIRRQTRGTARANLNVPVVQVAVDVVDVVCEATGVEEEVVAAPAVVDLHPTEAATAAVGAGIAVGSRTPPPVTVRLLKGQSLDPLHSMAL